MASRQSTIDLILDQIGGAGAVRAKRMFGEYGLYCGDTFFGVVCDDQLFIKPTRGGRALLGDAVREASPYPGAKPHLLLPGTAWDDAEKLTALVKVTVAELPAQVAKKPRTGKTRSRAAHSP